MIGDELEITKGWRYLVRFSDPDSEDVEGTFAGYAMVGTETAMVMETDGGRMRFILISNILFVDLLESKDGPRSARETTAGINYG